ncbi:MAG TPA: RNA polymerase sigma factor [Solirubrobacteraceae bacterium]
MYEREAEAVLMFHARRTLDPGLALDLTAETFAQAYRGRRSFRGSTVAEERAWLFTIAHRQLVAFFRRGYVERAAMRKLGMRLPAVHEDDLARIEADADLAALRGELGQELARLSVDQQRALRLRVIDELSYEQVASALGVSEATARARVSRGLRALAAALDARGAVKEAGR